MKVLAIGSMMFACLGMAGSVHADEPRSRLELQDYERMTLVGTFKVGKDWRACFRLPDGAYFVGQTGKQIGLRRATIVAIAKDSVELSEMVPVNQGEWADSRMIWPVSASAGNQAARCAR